MTAESVKAKGRPGVVIFFTSRKGDLHAVCEALNSAEIVGIIVDPDLWSEMVAKGELIDTISPKSGAYLRVFVGPAFADKARAIVQRVVGNL
jgi:hypothetical protein